MSSTATLLATRAPCRVADMSRYSQDREGAGEDIAVQHKNNCRFISEYPLWKHDSRPYTEGGDYYFDNDISASDGDPRPGYDALMAKVLTGFYDVIVVKSIYRFWRNDVERAIAIRDLKRAHVLVFETNGSTFDPNDLSDELSLNITGAVASHESKTKGKNIRVDVTEAFENPNGAAYHGSARPFGYRIKSFGKSRSKDRTLTHDPVEAPLLVEAARRVLGKQRQPSDGDYPIIHQHQGNAGESLRSIAADFSARGIHGVKGGPFTANALRKALIAPVTAGIRERQEGDPVGTWIPTRPGQKKPHGKRRDPDTVESRKGNWEPILDQDTYDRVCKILNDPVRNTASERERRYWLTGVTFCGICERRAHVAPVEGKLRIRCTPEMVDGKAQSGHFSRELSPVERTIRARIFEWMADDGLWDQSRFNVAGEDAQDLLRQKKGLEDDLDQWLIDYGDKTITKPKYLELKRRDERELARVKRELDRIQQQGDRDPCQDVDGRRGDDFTTWWKSLEREGDCDGLAKRHQVLTTLISRIDIYRQGKGHRMFDPTRVLPYPAAWHLGLPDPSAAQPPPMAVTEITTAQDQIVAFLAEHPGESFLIDEITEATKYFRGTVKVTLSRLVKTGVVTVTDKQGRTGMHPGQRGRGAYRYAIAPAGSQPGDFSAEGRIVGFLAAHPGQAFTRAEISAATGIASSTLSLRIPGLIDDGRITVVVKRGPGQPCDKYTAASRTAVA